LTRGGSRRRVLVGGGQLDHLVSLRWMADAKLVFGSPEPSI